MVSFLNVIRIKYYLFCTVFNFLLGYALLTLKFNIYNQKVYDFRQNKVPNDRELSDKPCLHKNCYYRTGHYVILINDKITDILNQLFTHYI